MIESGDTYIGVATDHVIESFRNRLWASYKTGAGIDRALLAQFHPLEEALAGMGVVVIRPMKQLEANDAPRRSAADLAHFNAAISEEAGGLSEVAKQFSVAHATDGSVRNTVTRCACPSPCS